MPLPSTAHLPADFVWGVATSAYQIEGGVDRDGRSPSIWDVFSHEPGRVRGGDTGDTACDHRARWQEDVQLIAGLGIPAYRLSLSWSRLQPTGRGPLSPSAVSWYRELLGGLLQRDVTPWVTLYHWDLPQQLELEGGWPVRQTAELFGRYVEQVVEALGDLVANWVTINEPWCSAFLGYGYGAHAPGRRDLRAAVAAGHHLNLAHGLATQALRARCPQARLGVTNIVADLVPADPDHDRAAVARLDAVNHQFFLSPVFGGGYSDAVRDLLDPYGLGELVHPGDLDLIGAPTDFVGVNHYQRVLVTEDLDVELTGATETPAGSDFTSFGWSITPDALTTVLGSIKERYTDLPLVITENGASFEDEPDSTGAILDTDRVDYLSSYVQAVDDAAADGVAVAGYFAWSLLDNFEWAEGYDKRFGLVYVDFDTQRRTLKSSAHHYAAIVAAHTEHRRPDGAVIVDPERAGSDESLEIRSQKATPR